MNKALFLDRDGVINYDYGYVHTVDKFKFTKNIFEICRKYQENGFLIIVITNQSGIERGLFSENDFENISEYMKSEFARRRIVITDIFHCPFLESADRKPNNGMFEKAIRKYNIDVSQSVAIGDNERDTIAAKASNIGKIFLYKDDMLKQTA